MKLIATMIAALGVSMTGGTTEASPSAMKVHVGAGKGASERAVEFRSKSYTAPDAMLVQVEGGTKLKRVMRDGKWVWVANSGDDSDSNSNSNSSSNSNSNSSSNSNSNSSSNSNSNSSSNSNSNSSSNSNSNSSSNSNSNSSSNSSSNSNSNSSDDSDD